ncbi:hypothetical protein ES703_91070 [subsurface metagenome]
MITLEQAIIILTELSKPGIAVWDADDIDAIKQGIEALEEKLDRGKGKQK